MFPFLQLFWPDPVFHCTVVPHHSGALRDLTSFGNMWFQTSCDTCVDEVTGCCHSSDEWECEECDESWQVSVPRGTWLHHLPRGSQVLEGLNQSVQQLKRGAPFSPFPIVYIHHYILQTHLQSFHRALGYRIVVSITKESEAWICCVFIFWYILHVFWHPCGCHLVQGVFKELIHSFIILYHVQKFLVHWSSKDRRSWWSLSTSEVPQFARKNSESCARVAVQNAIVDDTSKAWVGNFSVI